jgi:prepilin-type N-terminal cleavage/methylation domain-containing protein
MNFSRRRGFTVIELLVAISLIGFLASVTLSTLNSVKKKGKVANAQQFATQQNRAEGPDTNISS